MIFFIFFFIPSCIEAQIIINEFLPYPQSGYPEWIELHNPDSIFTFSTPMIWIEDASNRSRIEQIDIPPLGYLILCRDTALLKRTIGPIFCQLKQSSLPTLNNTSDKIKIRNQDSILIDSIFYLFRKEFRGKSMERYDINIIRDSLLLSQDPKGHTCGFMNACNPQDNDLVIESIQSRNKSIDIMLLNNGGRIIHDISIIISSDSIIKLVISKLEPKERSTLNIPINDNFLSKGMNHMNIESTHSDSDPRPYNNNGIFSHYRSFPRKSIMINEINVFEHVFPEYIEFRIMDTTLSLSDGYACILGNDTIDLQVEEFSEYVLMTKHDNWNIPSNISTLYHSGLAISNSGSIIQIIDPNGFVIDSIDYTHYINQYSSYMTNHSLEYIDSLHGGSWFVSTSEHGGTPGEINSRLIKIQDRQREFRLQKCRSQFSDCEEVQILHPFTIGIYSCDLYSLDGFYIKSIIMDKLISGEETYTLPDLAEITPSAYVLMHIVRDYYGTEIIRGISTFIKRN